MFVEQDYRHALLIHPFWDHLSPPTVRQRIDQLLEAPNSAELVQALPPVEYALLLKAAPEMRAALLALGHPEQIRTVLDLDCWQKDTLQSGRVLEWLEELQRSGEESFQQTLHALDPELLLVALRQYVRVHAALSPEEDPDPVPYDEVLANELYRVEFIDPDSLWNERIQRLLTVLRQVDFDFYHTLMQGSMWGIDSELEEMAYRWKSGRLQDEGFPDYYDALESYYMLEGEAPLLSVSMEPPGPPASAAETGVVPSYAWGVMPSNSLVARALDGDFDPPTLERLCWEMVALCNRELVIDQVDFADAQAVRTSLRRVHAYLNIGLDALRGQEVSPLSALLTTHALREICQVGVGLILRLRQRATSLHSQLTSVAGVRRTVSGLARQVFDGLLRDHPRFFTGLEVPGEAGYRDFLSTQDITLVDAVLRQLENDSSYRLVTSPASSAFSPQQP
jgi:hypothetical protein